MNAQTVKLLSGLLVVQIALVVAFSFLGGEDLTVYSSDEKIVAFSADQVDNMVIETLDETMHLKKEDSGQWKIKEANDFPADLKKVSDFLEQIVALKKTWPIAKTESALKPLKLTDSDFERKIIFKDGKSDLATMYLGTSPGFKKVHARLGGTATVYSVGLHTFEIPAKPEAWTDKEYLYINKDSVQSLQLPQVQIVRHDEGFAVEPITENQEPNTSEIDAIVSLVSSLRFLDVLGTSAPEKYDSLEKKVEFSLKKTDDAEVAFEARGPYEESFYVLKRADAPYYFKVAKGNIEKLMNLEPAALLKEKKSETPAEKDGDGSNETAAAE